MNFHYVHGVEVLFHKKINLNLNLAEQFFIKLNMMNILKIGSTHIKNCLDWALPGRWGVVPGFPKLLGALFY